MTALLFTVVFFHSMSMTKQRSFCGRHHGGKLYAIVTMVGGGTAQYSDGANVLARSLHIHMNRTVLRHTQLIAFVIDGPSAEESKHRLSSLWTTCEPPRIGKSSDHSIMFEKLWVYELLDFERVLFIDSDAFAVGDVSPLLVTPDMAPFAVTPDWFDAPLQTGARVGINTGVFSIKPDKDVFFKINKFRLENPAVQQEQQLLNNFYGNPPYEASNGEPGTNSNVTWFNFSYNAWLNGIGDGKWPPRGNWSEIWPLYQPAVIHHLIGHMPPNKPLDSVRDERSMIYRMWWAFAEMSDSEVLLAAHPNGTAQQNRSEADGVAMRGPDVAAAQNATPNAGPIVDERDHETANASTLQL